MVAIVALVYIFIRGLEHYQKRHEGHHEKLSLDQSKAEVDSKEADASTTSWADLTSSLTLKKRSIDVERQSLNT
jgi:hypothetical protein